MAAIIIIDDPEAGVSRVRNESFFSADATACACYAIAVAFSWPADRFVVGRSRHTWVAHTTSIPVGRSLLAPCHHLSYFIFLFSVILVLCHHIGLMEHFFRRGSSPGPPQPADEGRQQLQRQPSALTRAMVLIRFQPPPELFDEKKYTCLFAGAQSMLLFYLEFLHSLENSLSSV